MDYRKDVEKIPKQIIAALFMFILLSGCSTPEQPVDYSADPAEEIHLEAPSEHESEEIQPETQRFTIEELAQQAINSVAYIEVYNSEYQGYYSLGSGFVIDPAGIIVTNYHVIEGATAAKIEIGTHVFHDDEIRILAVEADWDLAILKVEARGLAALPLGKGIDAVGLGEPVIALGNPEGMKGTVSDGIISTVSRDIGLGINLIQTTAPISKGSSGGPLLNMYGEVIGVTSLTMSTGQNLNFAIPSDLVTALLSSTDQGVPITAFFGDRTFAKAGEGYTWQPGEFAVVLQWDDAVDLDLEIWSEDFEFIGAATSIGKSPDIYDGSMGEEWFVFEHDFSRGRYVVSVYFYDTYALLPADATLVIHFPDGQVESLPGSLISYYPYDQWYAVLIDVEQKTSKVLDFFFDADVIALLEWDTAIDLDLMIWDHIYDDIFIPGDIDGLDSMDGRSAVEVFRFGNYEDLFGYDFSSGFMDIFVGVDGPISEQTNTELKLINMNGLIRKFNHTFTPDTRGVYYWHVLSDYNPATQNYSIPPQARVYFD